MKRLWLLAAAISVIAWALQMPVRAADPRYPDWPCVQAKVPELSVAAVWNGPSIADVGNAWEGDPGIKDLVARLAARRTPLEAAERAIADFMVGSAAEKEDKAKKLFAGLFETLNLQRSEVMSGIERLARKEKELADKIRSDTAALRELQDKPTPNESEISALAGQVEWGTRIFEDRRKSIRYVCEVPTLIERRIFTLGRVIRQALD
jgi:hypothetical protein